ncbi:MAG: MFS transporter, partial [Eubacterium sp.]
KVSGIIYILFVAGKAMGIFMKEVKRKTIINFCLPQFAVGLFTTMLNNYLIYFYQPTEASGLPVLITQGYVVFGILTVIGLIKAVGHIIDAFSDPIVAGISDKSKNKNGRRIPMMKWFAVPFAVSALLIFWSPSQNHIFNNIWLAVFIWAYFVFYTLYMIPHNALLPEMITDEGKLVDAYTYSSLFFVVGSMLGYATTMIVAVMKKSFGLEPIMAWRFTFLIFTVIGVVLLLVPALTIKETDYVNSVRPTVPLMASLRHAFSNKHFVTVTLGQLFEGTGMSFFQACIMYYITELMGIPEEQSIIIMATSIVGSLALYPVINKWSKAKGKKIPMIVGCIVFTVAEFVICFADVLPKEHKMAVAIIFALFVSLPFAVLNILPSSMMADVIQYDTIKSGVNQEGTFAAAKSFVTKMGTSLAIMIVPSLVVIGAKSGESIGRKGLLITALVGGLFTLVSFVIYLFYNEKEVLNVIRGAKENKENQNI